MAHCGQFSQRCARERNLIPVREMLDPSLSCDGARTEQSVLNRERAASENLRGATISILSSTILYQSSVIWQSFLQRFSASHLVVM